MRVPHEPWPADEAEALRQQLALRERVEPGGPFTVRTVAGLDVSYDGETGRAVAAVVVLDLATLTVVETATATGAVAFPYVPGLLAFRELPLLADALERLTVTPDVLVCDGYGVAHPRRFGLACHLGVLTGLPAFRGGQDAVHGRVRRTGAGPGRLVPADRGRRRAGAGAAHPAEGETGLRLRRAPRRPGHGHRADPDAVAAVPAARDDQAGRSDLPAAARRIAGDPLTAVGDAAHRVPDMSESIVTGKGAAEHVGAAGRAVFGQLTV
ncbi:hypothetical protein Cme02nite_71660 [Catellatospora methionotrophica]|uniref:Uncharacterized protein n=1 Tax=Catellatospora methionotrophica TaxID=121620 RepID=A0A8J3LNJ3_9ACTN|nr:hypothetical protein Cme02nite_71660 [Catellatospora methionotrophica]